MAGSLIPVCIGSSFAFAGGSFLLSPFLVTLLGIASLHSAANLLNDYYDARGSDPINMRVTPFSGGSRVIQDGDVRAGTILTMAILSLVITLGTAIWLGYKGRPLVFPIGLLGLFAGWSYSSPPLQLMSRGWGEILIFFAFGPLISLGAYYVNTGDLSLPAFLLGFPQGFLITGVIWINQFPDYHADREAGKMNLVVRSGLAISRHLYCLIMLLSFVSIIFLTGMKEVSYLILLAFLSLPLAIRAMGIVRREYLNYNALIPAQALTIQTVIAQGLLLSLGLMSGRFVHA